MKPLLQGNFSLLSQLNPQIQVCYASFGKRQKDSKNGDVDEMRIFKNWAQPKTLVVSLLK